MQKNKNIFIGGVVRAGKSSLSEKISNNSSYNHIPLDSIVAAIAKTFPETKVSDWFVPKNENSEVLKPFLKKYLEKLSREYGSYIVDSAHIKPEYLSEIIDKENWEVVLVGYPNITASEKLINIRDYDEETSWTRGFDDEQFLLSLELLIDISKEYKQICDKNGFTFIDTSDSNNFKQIIEDAASSILIDATFKNVDKFSK